MALGPVTTPPGWLEALSDEDRAFLELLAGLHRQIEAMKLAYPAGVHATALDALQRAVIELATAATPQQPLAPKSPISG